jgi:phosphopantetheinyl transferase (holo-ACP synthase)
MNILQASDEAHSTAELYYGFDAALKTQPEVIVAYVDQSTIRERLQADKSLPSQALSSRELQVWMALGLDYTRKLHWLMGRIAAKKAIWKIISRTPPSASEIEIFNAEDGSPYFSCNTVPDSVARISIAHTDGLAIAAVSQAANLGIDVERIDRYGPASHSGDEFPQMSFSQEERTQIQRCVSRLDSTILTRVWTAKEAAGKAAQLGLGQILKHCRFVECNPDLSVIKLRTSEENGTIDVRTVQETVQERDFFLALAVQ